MSNLSALISASSGGGGGSQVNDAKYIVNDIDLIITADGEHWQKSGVTTADTVTYSDASVATGPISTTTDPEVTLPDSHDRATSGQSTTNGKWLWYTNASGSMQIRATRLDGTGSSIEAYNGANYANMTGRLFIHADGDGYMYTMHTTGHANSFQNRYHEIRRYQINHVTGQLTNDGNLGGQYLDFGAHWCYGLMSNDSSGRNQYLRVFAQAQNGAQKAYRVDKSSGNRSIEQTFYANENGVKIPQDIASCHEFNGEIWIKGFDGYMYVWNSNLTTFRLKVDVGAQGSFFSKTDSLSSQVLSTDTHTSMPSGSVSGVHNYQRMYEMTTNGYKNHPPGSIVGIQANKIESAGVNLYVRIK
tara:strand:+ start:133 stop:1209 length:1077 start_codon:yes stop_codon:yes gene_type:complete